jgi:hypothetical protein
VNACYYFYKQYNNFSAVVLCKHADVIQPTPMKNEDTGYLIIFKIIKVLPS